MNTCPICGFNPRTDLTDEQLMSEIKIIMSRFSKECQSVIESTLSLLFTKCDITLINEHTIVLALSKITEDDIIEACNIYLSKHINSKPWQYFLAIARNIKGQDVIKWQMEQETLESVPILDPKLERYLI